MANLIQMLEGQIRAGRAIADVRAKISGREGNFLLKEYTFKDKAGSIDKLTFVKEADVDKDDPEKVVISDKNCEIAHYAFNPNPKATLDRDDISVDGSKLSWKNQYSEFETELGFTPESILGSYFGRIYLTRATDNPDKVNLVSYEIQSDKISHSETVLFPGSKLFNTEKDAFIVSNLIKNEAVGKDSAGNPIMDNVVKSANVYALTPNYDYLTVIPMESYDVISNITETGNGTPVFIATGRATGDNRVFKAYDAPRVFVGDNEYTVEAKDAGTIVVNIGGKSNDVTILASDSTYMVIAGGFRFKTLNKDVVEALKDYTVFCGKYTEFKPDGAQVLKLILANEKDDVTRFTVDTTDRGQIITVDGKSYPSELVPEIESRSFDGYEADLDEDYDEEEEEDY